MTERMIDEVETRFAEAAETARRLPPARVRGYFSVWEVLLRTAPERRAAEGGRYHLPPTPAAVDRMLESMRWMQWLDQESRHIVWMRADRFEWQDICRCVGCNRSTAWRRWKRALMVIAAHLQA